MCGGGTARDAVHFAFRFSTDDALRAEKVKTCGTSARGDAAGSTGDSSTITCALVPPTPSEFTAARRGAAARGHGFAFATTSNGVLSMPMREFAREKFSDAGINPCR